MKANKAWTSLEGHFPRAEGRLVASCYRPGLMVLDRRTRSGQLVAGFCLGRSEALDWCQQPDGTYWIMLFWPQLWGALDCPMPPEPWNRWGARRHYKFDRFLQAGLLRTYLPWAKDAFAAMAHRPLKTG